MSNLDELCEKMLVLGAFAKGTGHMTGAEVNELLLPFFGQDVIDRASGNICDELAIEPNDEYVGVAIVRPGEREFWKIKCPCGIEVTYPINELPLVDTLHPCGDHKHWTVKFSDE